MHIITSPSKKQKKALICGCSGFIGSHLARRLKNEGYWLLGIDCRKNPQMDLFDEFLKDDLSEWISIFSIISDHKFDEIYQLADSSSEYEETEHSRALNESLIDANLLFAMEIEYKDHKPKVFLPSSHTVYGPRNPDQPLNPARKEDSPLNGALKPHWGLTKLYKEKLYQSVVENIRIARIFPTYGPNDTWHHDFDPMIAHICRFAALTPHGDDLEIVGPPDLLLSPLYIDDCVEGIRRLMQSPCTRPVNIGPDQFATMEQVIDIIEDYSGKTFNRQHIDCRPYGPRNASCYSDSSFALQQLGWQPCIPLSEGVARTYDWMLSQVSPELKSV